MVCPCAHRQAAVDDDVQVDKVADATLAHPAFIDLADSLDPAGNPPDFVDDRFRGSDVQHFGDGRAKQACAVQRDDAAGDQGGPIVGGFISRPADQRDRNADKRGREK